MSSFLFSASITLVLLSILPISIAFDLVDIDGDLIINGGAYYIIPIIPTTGLTATSGLTYTQKHEECPLYITPEKTENSPGTPVRISSPLRILYISLNMRVTLAFQDATHCNDFLGWKQTLNPSTRKSYITTGLNKITLETRFSITKADKSLLPIYEIRYWPSNDKDAVSSNVGLHEDGLLGITENPTPVSFKKAFNVLELPTS